MMVLLALVLGLALLLYGCEEAQKTETPVWGQGELTPEYTVYFGNDNGARLDWMQNQVISNIGQRVLALEGDPNSIPVQQRLEYLERQVHELTFVGPRKE
jgi:hypothetical protein